MIIPEVNLLVYAHDSAAPSHTASRRFPGLRWKNPLR